MSDYSFDIQYVANLARIALSPEEERKLGTQLSQILGYIEKLREVNVTNVDPVAHAFPLSNITRSDEIRPGLSPEDALRNAPAQAHQLFMVPKIVE